MRDAAKIRAELRNTQTEIERPRNRSARRRALLHRRDKLLTELAQLQERERQ